MPSQSELFLIYRGRGRKKAAFCITTTRRIRAQSFCFSLSESLSEIWSSIQTHLKFIITYATLSTSGTQSKLTAAVPHHRLRHHYARFKYASNCFKSIPSFGRLSPPQMPRMMRSPQSPTSSRRAKLFPSLLVLVTALIALVHLYMESSLLSLTSPTGITVPPASTIADFAVAKGHTPRIENIEFDTGHTENI